MLPSSEESCTVKPHHFHTYGVSKGVQMPNLIIHGIKYIQGGANSKTTCANGGTMAANQGSANGENTKSEVLL